jgi:hypothetical protein
MPILIYRRKESLISEATPSDKDLDQDCLQSESENTELAMLKRS